ncbi:UPF0280 family protein [Candidatus Oleimmundimicrobium sp.]|uniref:UPF0280 family protein n=1 Tax=Candidatus Oleimmundimicrobium sp. TaxID=3060597 RepID=UPI00271BB4E1|nr:UPF0280 family protein [Candidatus Oleimmundimicrobium sp.]MDO8886497.1 UPF0280 family protein [Candidatus Oleimmundimicrobium sp.]
MYREKFYRKWLRTIDLVTFQIQVEETDLFIAADKNLYREAMDTVFKYRGEIENYIEENPLFETSLSPIDISITAPLIVNEMILAAQSVDVGPMAAVAGAIAEFVGKDLLKHSEEIIVENGGDVFLKTTKPRLVGVYAGETPLSGKLALNILPEQTPLGICTSAGTVGHSLSFGKADAVVVLSKNTPLADAAATAIGNLVQEVEDIEEGLSFAKGIKDILGVLIIKDNKMGVWGEIDIQPL